MPWRERSLMDVRLRFVQDVHRPGWSVAEVCRRYQVSRKTDYKWLERYEKAGPAGLVDRSHRTYTCLHATPGPIVQQILALQRRFRWGARKVRWLLARRALSIVTPSMSFGPLNPCHWRTACCSASQLPLARIPTWLLSANGGPASAGYEVHFFATA